MAYDIFTGKTSIRNWSRGDEPRGMDVGMGNWLGEKIAAMATSKIPWKPVLVIAGIVAGLFIFPRVFGAFERRKDVKRTRDEFSSEWPDEPTVQLTRLGKSRESTGALLSRKVAA